MDETIEEQQQEAIEKSNLASPMDTTSHVTSSDSPTPDKASDSVTNQSTPGMVCIPMY